MGLTCLTCGDIGFSSAFVHCIGCLDFVVHRYCLDVIPKTIDEYIHWVCDDCDLKMQHTPYNINLKAFGNVKGLTVDSAELSNKLSSQENEVNAKDNQSKHSSVHEKQNAKEKKRSMVEPTMEEEHNSKKPRKECTSGDALRQAKSGKDSGLPEEKEDKNRDEKSLCDHPSGSNAKTVSGNNVKEDGVTASSGFDNQGFGMNCEARIITPTKNQNVFVKDPSVPPYFDSEAPNEPYFDPDAPNEPEVTPIWRGGFEILNPNPRMLEGFIGHLSYKACDKAHDVACQIQAVLQLEMVPKLDIWPKSFRKSKPSDNNIALYFFPSKTSVREFDNLIQEMMDNDFAMRAHVQNAELLLFPSTELPIQYWRCQEKYYIWGVFKGKQSALSLTKPSNEEPECEKAKNEG